MGLAAGARLGPYEIIAVVGSGGMGEVYRARETRLEREVAIKILPAALSGGTARDRFRQEVLAVAALQHPNICTIYDVGDTPDGHAFLVMELLQGETLEQRLGRGPLDVPLLLDVGIALADALESAHAQGIIHRDIKPANVFLTDRGPKILDFGVAKIAAPALSAASSTRPDLASPLLTFPDTTGGTAAYMSPEQLRGEALDPRSDLFSLGLVLYEMATGRRAFPGATSAVVSAAILNQHPPPPSLARRDLPAQIDGVIFKALEKDRTLRYAHATDVRVDLQRLRRVAPPGPGLPPVSDAAGARSRRWLKLAVTAVIIVVAAAASCQYVRSQAVGRAGTTEARRAPT
jgi:serine/threonine protein kinase